MAKGMGRDPGFTNPQPVTLALKELDECVLPERFTAPFSTTAHQEDKGAVRIFWTLVHHRGVERL
jgi:hypothetical protein